jgi:hypothetical protein
MLVMEKPREDSYMSQSQGWMKSESKKKKGAPGPGVYPKRHYWCGFNSQGKEKWYIELSNGRVVSHLDENYQYWLRKYKLKTKEEHKVQSKV